MEVGVFEVYGGEPLSWSDSLKDVDCQKHPKLKYMFILRRSSLGLRELSLFGMRKYVEFSFSKKAGEGGTSKGGANRVCQP